MNVLYFFIKDNIMKKVTFKWNYFPTDDIIAYYFTKTLQGKKLKKLRKIILNLKEELIG